MVVVVPMDEAVGMCAGFAAVVVGVLMLSEVLVLLFPETLLCCCWCCWCLWW